MRRVLTLAVLGLSLCAVPARAQTLVYDATAVSKLISQAETAAQALAQLKTQVSQGQTLLTSLNAVSNVNAIAATLSSPGLRAFLPDASALAAAARGDLSSLGALGASAAAIRAANRLYTSTTSDAAAQDLEAAGRRAALDQALGQSVADVSAQRLSGLQTLQSAVGGAGDARAAIDLQARLAAEQAMIANDQLRLQGLTLSEAAQDRIQAQRDRERALQSHAQAEAAFRSLLP